MHDATDTPDLRIRPMQVADADRVVAMVAALSAHEGAPPPPMDAASLVRWGLGEDARFSAIVAEWYGAVIGYALFHEGFHVGRGAPGTLLMDLFVERGHRRKGIARALLAAVARATVARQGDWITWQAHPRNTQALAFYDAIGARRFAAADFELADRTFSRFLEEET
ncbi:MAG: GNAT family N-acetyltransferase [Thalassobaculaceae bacterium]|nr:GNAT family N-acetyltransferase [Thalassobaculaceae bacterium]